MTASELQQEISYYFDDIREYTESGDLKSALIISRGLTNLIAEYKKSIGNLSKAKS